MQAFFSTNWVSYQAKNPSEFYITLRIQKNRHFVLLVVHQ